MKVIDQINGSALFAQSAYSASIATNDSLGRNISETYLTAVDLTPYATTADLASKQDTLTFDYDEQDRISAINNSAIAAGDEFPVSADEAIQYVQTNSANIDETVNEFQTNSSTYMVEPNLEYNAVGEISGYGNSAIAQYGAEKQWLTHDDTIVSISNSAQYAFGCNISALQRLMGIDETVLFSGNTTGDFILSETPSTFNYLRLEYGANDVGSTNVNVITTTVPAGIPNYGLSHLFKSNPNTTASADVYKSYAYYSGCSTTAWVKVYGTISQTPFTTITNNKGWTRMYKIVGIGRKS